MAPQGNIPPVATVLSTIGTVFWCVQLIPQIWHNWRRKDTTGLPASMMLLWTVCSVPFGTYDTVQRFAIPLIIQPQIFGSLALVVWAQCKYYGSGWSAKRTVIVGGIVWLIAGGIEALLILTLRPVYDRGVEWPMIIVGTIAAVLLVIGFIPVVIEMVHRRGRVVGINFVFLFVDWLGAFFSLMGVVTQGTFDILGGVLYSACAGVELLIFISQGIWLLRTWHLHQQAKRMGVHFDDLPEARKYQWKEKDGAGEGGSSEDDVESQTTAVGSREPTKPKDDEVAASKAQQTSQQAEPK